MRPSKPNPPQFDASHSPPVGRRSFLRWVSCLAASAVLSRTVDSAFACAVPGRSAIQSIPGTPSPVPDYRIEIAEIDWELAPRKKIRTTAYNGQIPGKLLRLTEGKPVTIDIANHLDRPEIVHWHGQWIPPDMDGSMEEGSPMIPAGGSSLVHFMPRPSGLH
jgi:FtsP/CotA-like multicopper oxidase with cupredoxin domain